MAGDRQGLPVKVDVETPEKFRVIARAAEAAGVDVPAFMREAAVKLAAPMPGYQGDRWGIVLGCTCLWVTGRPAGWSVLAEDANCPAHHPDSPAHVPVCGRDADLGVYA